jgi:hypothetical protein
MPRGRKTHLTLPETDRATLQRWHRSLTIRAGLAQRGRLILLVAAGHTLTDAAAKVGLSRTRAHKWLKRYEAQGVAGLWDKPRHRRPQEHPAVHV